jgi:hypothetical protein
MNNNDGSIDALSLLATTALSSVPPASLRTAILNPLFPLTMHHPISKMGLRSLAPFLLVLTFLFFSSPSSAAVPTVWIDPTLPPDLRARLSNVWTECIQLARLAAITFEADCKFDPNFDRYFEEEGAIFVKNIFYTLANIPLDTVLTEATATQLFYSSTFIGLSPKFSKLTIAFGEPPWLPERGTCSDVGFGAYGLVDDFTGEATIVLCDASVLYPTLDEIAHPQPWAYDEQGRLREGYTCDGLLDHDSEYMLSVGGFEHLPLLRLSFQC